MAFFLFSFEYSGFVQIPHQDFDQRLVLVGELTGPVSHVLNPVVVFSRVILQEMVQRPAVDLGNDDTDFPARGIPPHLVVRIRLPGEIDPFRCETPQKIGLRPALLNSPRLQPVLESAIHKYLHGPPNSQGHKLVCTGDM